MKVFITHGHNDIVKLKIKDFVASRMGLEPVILGEQPGRQGLTIIEALEKYSVGCEFAIILLTGDDGTQDGGRRARQNVIHEIGFFQGRLGRAKVVLIVEKGVEIPSNLSGLFYLEYAKEVKEVFLDLETILEKKDASASAKTFDLKPLTGFVEQMTSVDNSWVSAIAKELAPYSSLPAISFLAVVRPVLQNHGEGYAKQAHQFKEDAEKRRAVPESKKKEENGGDAFTAMLGFAGALLIGPSEKLAQLCKSAVTIIDTCGKNAQDQEAAKKTILHLFGIA